MVAGPAPPLVGSSLSLSQPESIPSSSDSVTESEVNNYAAE